MAKGTIGGKIVLEGEAAYRAALKNIKTEQAELKSEMKLCQTTFRDSQNSLQALTQKYEILTKQVDTQAKKVQVYEQAMEASSKKEENAAKRVEELKTALADAEKKMEEMADSSDTTSEAMDGQAKAVQELQTKLAGAESDYDKAAQKTKTYQTAVNNAEAELTGMQSELASTEKYMKEAESATDNCATSIDEYGKETDDASDKTIQFGDVLKANLASEAIITGVKALAKAVKGIAESAIETGTEFEASMSIVAGTMGMTADEINNGSEAYQKLEAAAKECGETTKYSASEAAEAENYLALAGYNVEKTVATLPKVLNLAAAGDMDLAYASDLVTDSMSALGMETEELDNYIDEMAKTSQKSNTSIAQLGEATLVCAGTVTLTSQSLETMNTELGILANNGIKGAEGGTHLRNILLSLSAPTETASMKLEALGVEVAGADGSMRDLNDIMIDLNASLSGMSDTEKTQAINKIFNKTDIAAVNALLKGCGEEYANLNAEIRNCSGAAETMADTVNNNLKGKVTILQSALEGLGIAAYQIFDDDLKTSVEGATQAVGRLTDSISNGKLNVSLNKLSDSMSGFIEGAVDLGEEALPTLIDGLSWLLDNADIVASGVAGIAASNVAMGTVAPAIQAATAAWKTYKAANEGATVTQWLLNAAMDANPAGILVTAITGLTAAVAAYCFLAKDATSESSELAGELEASAQSLKDYSGGAEAVKTDMEAQMAVCRKLKDEILELNSKEELSVGEQARLKEAVGQLNAIIPDLALSIDETTGKLSGNTAELEKNIDQQLKYLAVQAAQEELTEIYEKQAEAELEKYKVERQMADLQEEIAAKTQECTERNEEWLESIGNSHLAAEQYDATGAKLSYELMELKNQYGELEESLVSYDEAVEASNGEVEVLNQFINENAEALSASAEAAEGAAAAQEGMGEAAAGAGEAVSAAAAEMEQAYTDMYDAVRETVEDQISLFSQFSGEAELTTQELLGNMQSQVDGITNWADNMEELADRGINQGLLQTLADLGPEGAGYVATFVQMTDEELEKANELFTDSLYLSDSAADKIAEAYVTAGQMAVEGYVSGVQEKEEEAAEAAEELGNTSLESLEGALDINSPSRETEKDGEYFDEGLSKGIKSGQQGVLDTIQNLCGAMLSTASSGITVSMYAEIGAQIPAGLAQGIKSGKSAVTDAIEEMCTEALETAKSALDIHSPSRKAKWLGEMYGEGFALGVGESMADINGVVAASLPDESAFTGNAGSNGIGAGYAGKNIQVQQEINIYSQTDDLVESTRKFKQAQKEAATEW